MADSKITALTAISTVDPTADPLVIVDVSDTSMAASGTTKKSTINQLLGAGGTATLASATISGDLTVDTSTLKVDSANNRVGVGTASPAVALDVVGSAQFSGNLTMTTGSLNSQYWYGINATSMLSSGSGSWPLLFGINGSEKARIDASGNLLVGVTSALFNSRLRVKTSSTSASDYGMYVADSADALIFALRNDGLIYTGTKTASPYNNTTGSAANAFIASDGTLGRSTSSLKYKTDITDSTRGLADVLKLRPVTYKSKNGDDTIFGGLIAEEVHAAGLTEFVAYAPDNSPDAIHYSNMVSLLVAAIKELTARVQTLEAK